jgi:hypothetical protein
MAAAAGEIRALRDFGVEVQPVPAHAISTPHAITPELVRSFGTDHRILIGHTA